MYVNEFDWDEANRQHIARHHVGPDEVEESLVSGRPHIRRTAQERYLAYGQSESGRYLYIVFMVKKAGFIRIITARDMTAREKRFYRGRRK